MKLSVIIPCYNEERTIAEAVARARAADVGRLEREILVVDDGSTDGSAGIIAGLDGVRAFFHAANRGKGAAVRTGLAAAGGDVLLLQDADLEYDARDYKALLEPIVAGRADAVMGSRFAPAGPSLLFGERRSPYLAHYAGNAAIVLLTNLLYGQSATDYEGAYKAFRREAVAGIPLESEGFELDNELICKLLRSGARVAEVPIRYDPRTYSAGKKIRWTDGLRMLREVYRWRHWTPARGGTS